MAPTITRGMINQYNTGVTGGSIPSDLFIREVPKMIEFIRRMDHPMLKLVKPGGTRDKLKWEFGSGDLAPRDTASTAAFTNAATTIPVADGKMWAKWFIGRVPSTGEQFLVTAISANNLTVLRNWPAGGTGVATGGAVNLQILGPAQPEGADAVDSPVAMGEVDFTYPQILEYTWTYTHRGRVTPNYEVKTDQFKNQAKKKMKEAANDLDSFLLHGLRDPGLGDTTRPSTMGGLRQFTSTRTKDLAAAVLTMEDIMTLLETVYKDVGQEAMGKVVMGSPFTKRIWNSWFQKSRRTGAMDKKISLRWEEVETDYGVMRFVLNYKMDDNELFVWNPDDAELDHYEGGTWSTGLYSTQGWYDRGFLRGDYGGIFQAGRRRARFFNYSVSAAAYDLEPAAA